ncbi:MAG TPA: exonuclease domain-containing protein [Acidimicrobiales bacterium]|nr:exonuclease domain-containing protein [Acidimicrobiales bacterium]
MESSSNPRLVAFDLETTGVDAFFDRPVSFGFVERGSEGGFLEVGGLVNPGVAIPPGAASIHGITDVMVRDAPLLADAIELIAESILEVWRANGAIVGMNVAYDLTMVNSVLVHFGLAPLLPVGPVLDILIIDRHFDRWRRGSRRLSDLCTFYGVRLDDAHAAVDDARASLLVLEEQFRRFDELRDLAVDVWNENLGQWYRDWLANFSAYLEKRGELPIGRGRYSWPVHMFDSQI